MGSNVTWWQFSDLHWPSDPPPERIDFINRLLAELAGETFKKHGAPNFVTFTGDIAATGSAEEYESVAQHLITPVRKFLDQVRPGTPIVAVPGNHDLNRRDAEMLRPDRITGLSNPAAIDEFLANPRTTRTYLEPFRDYQEFAATHLDPRTADPLSWTLPVGDSDVPVTLTGINSAWSSYYPELASERSDERQLLVGINQLQPGPQSDPGIKILLAHHPTDWLNQDVCARVIQRIRSGFDVMLSGHVHSPKDLHLVSGSGGNCCFLPSPLLYMRQYEDSLEFARAFVVASIDTSAMTLRADYYRYSDAFGTPKFLPYDDIYTANQRFYSAVLRSRAAADPTPTDADPASATSIADLLWPSPAAQDAYTPREVAAVLILNQHAQQILHDIIRGLDRQLARIIGPDQLDAARLALLLVRLSVARGEGGFSADARNGISSDVAVVAQRHSLAAADVETLQRLIDSLRLTANAERALAPIEADQPIARLLSLLWGIGQIALLMDQPALIPSYEETARSESRPDNVLGVSLEEHSGRLKLRVKTADRNEFHRLAEAQHAISQYFAQVDDVWRDAGLMPLPIRFDLEYPLWRHKSVENHSLRVDPQPISRLLMGKALYGSRPHVWLRELIQNAVDATETRRRLLPDPSYEPAVTLRFRPGGTVTVADNGVGMSHEHILYYLTILGRSGWRSLSQNDAGTVEESNFFGRFGIGFASVFSVARSVTVVTRQAHTRSVDGIRVNFSSPDRPFFIEPVACQDGTNIDVHLADSMSLATLEAALAELFIYLPAALTVEPKIVMPKTLGDYSALDHIDGDRPALLHRVSNVSEGRLGGYPLRLKVEVVVPERKTKTPRGYTPSPWGAGLPAGVIDVAVDGIRVVQQRSMSIEMFGQPETKPSHYRQNDSLELKGVYVTIDFDRDNAPVLPSRDKLDLEKSAKQDFAKLVVEALGDLLLNLANAVADGALNDQQARSKVLSVFRECMGDFVKRGRHHSDVLRKRAAAVYRDKCKVQVYRKDTEEESLLPLADLDPRQHNLAVVASVAKGKAFQVYARSEGLRSWIVADNAFELSLLDDAWPADHTLRTIRSSDQLLFFWDSIGKEVRTGELVKLLRADYALIDSEVFNEGLFFYVPSDVAAIPRDQGVRERRNTVDPGQPPRVALNHRHPLLVAIEEFLGTCTPQDRDAVSSWIDRLFQGVIEDKNTVRAPRAHWDQLRSDLLRRFELDFSDLTFDALRVHI